MGLKEYLSGLSGEDKAAKYLRKNGFKVLKRNFHSKYGEIDIIASKAKILHFIEVKSTKGDYEVAYRLTPKKYEKLLKAIGFYQLSHEIEGDFVMDLLCIYPGKIIFYENISY